MAKKKVTIEVDEDTLRRLTEFVEGTNLSRAKFLSIMIEEVGRVCRSMGANLVREDGEQYASDNPEYIKKYYDPILGDTEFIKEDPRLPRLEKIILTLYQWKTLNLGNVEES